MSKPSRLPDRSETFFLGLQKICLSAWHKLHFRELPTLIGLALRVEFLKSAPMWLF